MAGDRGDSFVGCTGVGQLTLRQYVVQYLFNKDADGHVVRTEIDKAEKRFPKCSAG